MTPEQFRGHGRELIDWLADYRTRLEVGELAATAQVRPGWLRERLPPAPPTAAEPFAAIRADLDRLVLRALVPERARALGQSPEIVRLDWERFKERWQTP